MTREVRLMRGQVVIREDKNTLQREYQNIIVPEAQDRERTSHRGVVLAMGPPMQTKRGVDVPHGFMVGDVVQFHWEHLEKAWTNRWTDGLMAAWVPQKFVDAVVE